MICSLTKLKSSSRHILSLTCKFKTWLYFGGLRFCIVGFGRILSDVVEDDTGIVQYNTLRLNCGNITLRSWIKSFFQKLDGTHNT
jgi:hypothetical protein